MMSALRPGRRRASSLANEGAGRKALRDAHRWLDELLVDPTQTIELLAIREGKSERSIRMTLSLAFMSPALAPPRSNWRTRSLRSSQSLGLSRFMASRLCSSCNAEWKRNEDGSWTSIGPTTSRDKHIE